MKSSRSILMSSFVFLGCCVLKANSFAPRPLAVHQRFSLSPSVLHADQEEEPPIKRPSLEEKMATWEATEEEQKAASLGGVVPGRSDGFDLALYILFPFMVLSGLAFAFFPLIMDKIDVNSVGPPPTV